MINRILSIWIYLVVASALVLAGYVFGYSAGAVEVAAQIEKGFICQPKTGVTGPGVVTPAESHSCD